MVTKTTLVLVRKPCRRPSCPLFEQVHPNCTAHNVKGLPCLHRPMTSQNTCQTHGGRAPAAMRAAKKRTALTEARSIASRIVDYNPDFDESPAEGLLREVRWSAQVAMALGMAIDSVVDDSGVVSITGQGVKINALIGEWTKERDLHAKLCKMALDAGIEQRRLDIVESQASQIVNAMLSLLTSPRLALTSEQIIEGRVVASEVIRALVRN